MSYFIRTGAADGITLHYWCPRMALLPDTATAAVAAGAGGGKVDAGGEVHIPPPAFDAEYPGYRAMYCQNPRFLDPASINDVSSVTSLGRMGRFFFIKVPDDTPEALSNVYRIYSEFYGEWSPVAYNGIAPCLLFKEAVPINWNGVRSNFEESLLFRLIDVSTTSTRIYRFVCLASSSREVRGTDSLNKFLLPLPSLGPPSPTLPESEFFVVQSNAGMGSGPVVFGRNYAIRTGNGNYLAAVDDVTIGQATRSDLLYINDLDPEMLFTFHDAGVNATTGKQMYYVRNTSVNVGVYTYLSLVDYGPAHGWVVEFAEEPGVLEEFYIEESETTPELSIFMFKSVYFTTGQRVSAPVNGGQIVPSAAAYNPLTDGFRLLTYADDPYVAPTPAMIEATKANDARAAAISSASAFACAYRNTNANNTTTTNNNDINVLTPPSDRRFRWSMRHGRESTEAVKALVRRHNEECAAANNHNNANTNTPTTSAGHTHSSGVPSSAAAAAAPSTASKHDSNKAAAAKSVAQGARKSSVASSKKK